MLQKLVKLLLNFARCVSLILHVIRFNGQAVPGSPFTCKVSPGNVQPRLPISGTGIELAAVGIAAEIKLEGTGMTIKIFIHALYF